MFPLCHGEVSIVLLMEIDMPTLLSPAIMTYKEIGRLQQKNKTKFPPRCQRSSQVKDKLNVKDHKQSQYYQPLQTGVSV
ncbi:hypothetical protein BaRGS_00031468 [Batillaria attramentaria]|uniref:DNA-directed RNA polymerase n=1 Tax=Batillaria attramentaria TaxID=370345 RepID=A0ABD0JRH8_9CAEN